MEIARFTDTIWPDLGIDHIRATARAIAENEEGKLAFLHIEGEDIFGKRDHLETCGGGIEPLELPEMALRREVQEELGYSLHSCHFIGTITDRYNLLRRETHSSFYHVYLNTGEQHTSYTEGEKLLVKEIIWLTKEEALNRLENDIRCPVGQLVQQRDAFALRYYLTHSDE